MRPPSGSALRGRCPPIVTRVGFGRAVAPPRSDGARRRSFVSRTSAVRFIAASLASANPSLPPPKRRRPAPVSRPAPTRVIAVPTTRFRHSSGGRHPRRAGNAAALPKPLRPIRPEHDHPKGIPGERDASDPKCTIKGPNQRNMCLVGHPTAHARRGPRTAPDGPEGPAAPPDGLGTRWCSLSSPPGL
jgi:hypothetical protein